MNMHMLFDLDGTPGNTLPLCFAAFREAIEPLAHRRLPDEEIIAQFEHCQLWSQDDDI